MRESFPFTSTDLDDLDSMILDKALAVVPMRDIAAGTDHPSVIGLRHDVDNEIESSVEFARWEAERGYRATYFILHTAPYWNDKTLLRKSLEFIVECGHEIGLHNDAVSEAILTKRDPRILLAEAVGELRDYGFEVTGTVAHGSHLCYATDGTVRYVNDELFVECPRPSVGTPNRSVAGVELRQSPLSAFGFTYEAGWLHRGAYLSDSGGAWSQPFAQIADGFPFAGQLHLLVHPCWWQQAFVQQEIAA